MRERQTWAELYPLEPIERQVINRCYHFARVSGRRGILILAAGASQRMGTPKALLPWGDSTLIRHALDQARSAGVEDVVVVLGPATRHLELAVKTVFNPEPETGRSTSIRLGAAALEPDLVAFAVQSVDQPVSAEVLSALFDAVGPHVDLAVPSYRGRRGHPVCFAGRLLAEVEAVSEESEGLRAVVRQHADGTVEVPVDDESVVWNLNDPAAYEAARARQ
jgi:molybdenum cofactor cytidylyltransferase